MSVTELQELVRFLEDRFACAQACTECARACALRASLADIDGPESQQLIRRKGMLCTEVCDATCRLLAEQVTQSEDAMRSQVEWCRTVCLETAQVFDLALDPGSGPGSGPGPGSGSGSEESAQACRDCARACTEFLTQLR
ncbi:four-helix bundle copper-binding protein [Streptomyces sp. NPDC059517]|uniref:four-helix bundle copper-binding protein n=1 Tax=Streptomyces sp. NPDC059517 TaxID=3346855 RepID=UPI0036A76C15